MDVERTYPQNPRLCLGNDALFERTTRNFILNLPEGSVTNPWECHAAIETSGSIERSAETPVHCSLVIRTGRA